MSNEVGRVKNDSESFLTQNPGTDRTISQTLAQPDRFSQDLPNPALAHTHPPPRQTHFKKR